MGFGTTTGKPAGKNTRFTGSLARTVVIGLVILAMLPAGIMAIATYLRSKSLLIEQVTTQLQAIVDSHSKELVSLINLNDSYMANLLSNEQTKLVVENVLANSGSEQESALNDYTAFFKSNYKNFGSAKIDQFLLVDRTGKVLFSTNAIWKDLNLASNSSIMAILGKTASIVAFNPQPLYSSELVIFTAKLITGIDNKNPVTMILASQAPEVQSILASASSLFPSAKANFLSINNILAGQDLTYGDPTIFQQPSTDLHLSQLKQMVQTSNNEGSAQYSVPDTGAVLGFAKFIPELQVSLILEVPEEVVLNPINAMIPFNAFLFIAAMVVAVGLTYFGSMRIVNPLVQLANHARQFSQGDWSARAVVTGNDEIGLLADSFNHMVGQISDLYRSLELKVDERTRQLRTASEVGQIATSANNREEIIQRAVSLIVERFGFVLASIFTVDESGSAAVLQDMSSQSREKKLNRGYRLPVNSESLIGWVITNNQSRVVENITQESIARSDLLLPESQSEIAIPISLGAQVLGVLEVQSVRENGFEPETISVLQTLTNQIANGLQNLRLLEATQINLEETSLLYRTSRQISLTKNAAELFQSLTTALTQTPYISGIFSVQEDHLSIISITDPRSPTTVIAPQGVTLPLQNVAVRLSQTNLVLVENLSQPSEYDNLLSFFSRRGCRSAAIFPILESGKLSRIIVLGSRSLNPLTATVLQPFGNLVEVMSTTLERLNVVETLQRRINDLQTLTNLSEVISAETDLTSVYQVLHQQVTQLIGTDISFAIALYDQAKNTISLPYLYENRELLSIDPFPLGEGLTSILIKNRKPLMLIKDTEAQAKALGAKVVGKTAKSWLGLPLIVGGQVVGAIIVQDTQNEERFTEADLNLFMTLAPQIGTTIRNAQLLTQMQEALQAYDQERFLINNLLSNIPDHITFKNRNGNYIRVSQSFATVHGFSNPSDLIGKSALGILPDLEEQIARVDENGLLEYGAVPSRKIEKQVLNGQDYWMLTSKIPMIDSTGSNVGILGIARDISELKNAEELSQRRAQQLQIAADIARDTSSTLDITETLSKAVNLIRDRFGYYHASIFMLDSLNEFAVLTEAAGEIGKIMKARGHRLAVGSQSIVGQATFKKQPMVINDVRKESNYYPNPLLPETRAELTVPLMAGEQVLGVIDVQSREANAFSQEVIDVLKVLADQLAIAVLNGRLYARTQENLGQHRLLHQITVQAASAANVEDALAITVQALHSSRTSIRAAVFLINDQGRLEIRAAAGYSGVEFSNLSIPLGEGIVGLAAQSRNPVRVADTANRPEYILIDPEIRSELAIPIIYSEKLVGVLNLESTTPGAFDENDQEIIGSLGNTLGAIIANAQLVRAVRQQVERQKKLYEATSKIRRSVDIDTILETSSQEICKALGAHKARIEVTIGHQETKPAPVSNNGNGHNNGKDGRS